MFEHLGVTAEQSAVYELLVAGGSRILSELSGVSVSTVDGLVALGLVQRRPGDVFQAVAPDLAVELLIARREAEHVKARLEAVPLMERYLRASSDEEDSAVVEVVTGISGVLDLWHTLLLGARSEVCVLDQPPYLSPQSQHVALEEETRERGVLWRVVYDRSSVDLPGRVAEIVELVAAGERARVTPTLPFKLAVVDARVAVLPVASGEVVDRVLLIRPSPLLDVLVSTFELYWDKGIPFSPGGIYASASDVDPHLLGLLAAGLTDESIARQLGLAPRTVQRRVRQLMDRCGAQTRFQAGVQAMRRGWL